MAPKINSDDSQRDYIRKYIFKKSSSKTEDKAKPEPKRGSALSSLNLGSNFTGVTKQQLDTL